MKKNNKGFTLIELLAALVILGLLVMIGLPKLTSAITSSKDKVYVSDAKRLIAQTEYKVKVNSSVVELPSDGNCIVVGLKYLDASDFDSPPNDGEYLEDQSFAVIKNKNGKFEYSARLIEQYKDDKGYKGIELSKNDDLDKNGGLTCVKTFKKTDVTSSVVDLDNSSLRMYVNEKLGTLYCNEVEYVYNELDLDDGSANKPNETPKIISATLTSASGSSNFNSFDFTFRLKADDDGGRDDLKVCYDLESYDNVDSNCVNYSAHSDSNTGVFSLDFDLGAGRSYAENYDPVVLYFVVRDSEGGYAKRQVSYEFHKNQPPVIDAETSKISSDGSLTNTQNTEITLNVSDDITSVENLRVCFDEGDTGRCTEPYPEPYTYMNYNTYASFFGNGNRMKYTINHPELDGSTHVIKVYVIDEYGARSEPLALNYTLHKQEVPGFQTGENDTGTHVTVQPIKFKGVTDQSLKVKISFSLLDDLGNVPTSDIGVKISEVGTSNSYTNTYNYVKNGYYEYLFGSTNKTSTSYLYDGTMRKLKVTVYQKSNPSVENYEIIDYKVHLNTKPVVTLTNLVPEGSDACVPGYRCDADQRHSKNVRYFINVSDDIDVRKNLKFCISEDYEYCNPERTSHYKKLASDSSDDEYSFAYNNLYTFSVDSERPYLGAMKNLYFFVKDTYNTISVASIDGGYQLYNNKAPFIDDLEIIDNGDTDVSNGSLNLKVIPRLYSNDWLMYDLRDHGGAYYFADDMTDNKYLAYEITVNNTAIKYYDNNDELQELKLTAEEIESLKSSSSTNWDNILTFDKILNTGIDLKLDSSTFVYNGQTLEFKLTLTDGYGVTSTFTGNYQLYNNKPPTIDRFLIDSSDPPCEGCSGGYTVNVDLAVSDDIDDSNLLVCVNEDLDYCSYNYSFVPYDEYFENKLYQYTFRGANTATPYNGQSKKLYVAVKDKYSDTAYSEIEYNVYENVGPEINGNASIVSQNGFFNSRSAYFNVNVNDDFGVLYERVCYRLNSSGGDFTCDGEYRPYSKNFRFTINDVTNYSGQVYLVYADIMDAYGKKATTNQVLYTLGNDAIPEINDVTGMIRSGSGIVSFTASDYGDILKACVLKSGVDRSNCNFNSSASYDGSTNDVFTYTFSDSGLNTSDNYVLYLKDTHNNYSTSIFKFSAYSDGNACASGNVSTKQYITYTPVNNNNIINADKCSGRCYYWDKQTSNGKVIKEASDTNNIKVDYTMRSVSLSKFNQSKVCNTSSTTVKLNCGSYECFNNGTATNKNYNNRVIGMVENVAHEDMMYFDEQNVAHVINAGDSYYKMYTSSYNDGDGYITLNPTSNIVAASLIDNYKYSSTASVKYLRALDSETAIISKPVVDSVAARIKLIKDNDNIAVGDRVDIGTESFHVIKINSSNNEVSLLADHNYLYGDYYSDSSLGSSLSLIEQSYSGYCKQNPDSRGENRHDSRLKGVHGFSTDLNFWNDNGRLKSKYGSSFPAYVYESEHFAGCQYSIADRFDIDDIKYKNIRYMSYEEATAIGCGTRAGTCPDWAGNGTYWLGSLANLDDVWIVSSNKSLKRLPYDDTVTAGIRYVITVDKQEIVKK